MSFFNEEFYLLRYIKNNEPAETIVHAAIPSCQTARPLQFGESLYKSAIIKLIYFLDRTQKRKSKSRFTYTQPRKYVAYSVVTSFLKGEKFSAKKCAEDKDINRENVQKILRDGREAGYITEKNQPTQMALDAVFATIEEWLYSPEINELVATVAAARHMLNMHNNKEK